MEMRADRDPQTGTISVTGSVTQAEYVASYHPDRLVQELAARVREHLVDEITKQFLEEHLQDVLAEINPVAVANLAVARAAQKIQHQFITPDYEKEKP